MDDFPLKKIIIWSIMGTVVLMGMNIFAHVVNSQSIIINFLAVLSTLLTVVCSAGICFGGVFIICIRYRIINIQLINKDTPKEEAIVIRHFLTRFGLYCFVVGAANFYYFTEYPALQHLSAT